MFLNFLNFQTLACFRECSPKQQSNMINGFESFYRAINGVFILISNKLFIIVSLVLTVLPFFFFFFFLLFFLFVNISQATTFTMSE